MAVIDMVAKELHMKPNDLIKESLKNYLERKITTIEAEIFVIAEKYGVKDIFELDAKIKEGIVRESDSYDDYFTLDNLEAECEKLKKIVENL